jgi:murein DD-endopeptidase MepM/ murein hydrolase activator NlpD
MMSGVKEFHSGVDYGAKVPGVDGDIIVAVADGIVQVAKDNPEGYGLYIVIEHDGFCTLYAHLNSFNCKVGDKVTQGQKIAYMGSTGRSTATHLHFEVRPIVYNKFWERQVILGKSKPLHMVDPLIFIGG